MSKKALSIVAAVLVCAPVALVAQNKAATYITKEQVDIVNKQQGTDRTIRVLDIGHENFAVGVIHRGPTGARPRRRRRSGCRTRRRPRRGARRAGRELRRGRQHASSGGHADRSVSRVADRGVLHHLRRRHDGDRRADRQRTEIGAGRRGDDDAEWSVVQRQHHGAGRGDAGSKGRRHHHHSGRRSARMDDDSRSRRLSQLPPVAACADGRLRASVDRRTESMKSKSKSDLQTSAFRFRLFSRLHTAGGRPKARLKARLNAASDS